MSTPLKPSANPALEGGEAVHERRNGYKTPFKAEADKATKLTKTYLTPGESVVFETNYRLACIRQKKSRSQYIKERILAKEEGMMDSDVADNDLIGRTKKGGAGKEEIKLMVNVQLNRLDELTKSLNKIGVNYNQSTRRLNQFDLPPDILSEGLINKELGEQIAEVLTQLENLYKEIEYSFSKKQI